jgi:competence protein ComEA
MRHHRRAEGADAELRLQAALRDRVPVPQPALEEPSSEPDVPAAGLAAVAATVGAAASERLPRALRDGVIDPRPRGAWTIVAVAVVAAAAAGLVLLRARPSAVAVVPPQVERPATAQPSGSAQPVLIVDVTGAVRRPGLRRLPPGSRVADAIKAAGGVLPGTKATGVNLARKLVDGEQIVVGGSAVGAAPGGGSAGAGSPTAGGGPVNLNTATIEQLDTLSGIGPVTAQRIIDWREAHGGFTSIDQLREVDGIGERRFASLRPQVTV